MSGKTILFTDPCGPNESERIKGKVITVNLGNLERVLKKMTSDELTALSNRVQLNKLGEGDADKFIQALYREGVDVSVIMTKITKLLGDK